ncbi:MAG: sigma-70 family RNA polymerase sigma factor [Blastocatellia bacterium]
MAKFYDLTKGVTFGLICRILGDRNLAEEVLMDVYMQVWHQSSNYDPQRGSAFSWLVIMARCRAIDRIRSSRYKRHECEPIESAFNVAVKTENPEQASLFSERRIQVRTALATLSREQREVIEIGYFGGYTQTEIADRLSLPLGTVKTRMRCGLMKLKESLTSM